MLDDFEDDEVTAAKLEIRGLGGGLNEALKFENWTAKRGERMRIVLEVETASLRFDPDKDEDGETVVRVHITKLVKDRMARATGEFDTACQRFLNAHQEQMADWRQQEEAGAGEGQQSIPIPEGESIADAVARVHAEDESTADPEPERGLRAVGE